MKARGIVVAGRVDLADLVVPGLGEVGSSRSGRCSGACTPTVSPHVHAGPGLPGRLVTPGFDSKFEPSCKAEAATLTVRRPAQHHFPRLLLLSPPEGAGKAKQLLPYPVKDPHPLDVKLIVKDHISAEEVGAITNAVDARVTGDPHPSPSITVEQPMTAKAPHHGLGEQPSCQLGHPHAQPPPAQPTHDLISSMSMRPRRLSSLSSK